jgi:O-acetyl-ADP-ribose deacetylase (regulator of RNase III)
LTQGYELPAKFVIHTVGPVWSDGDNNEDELLASCYRKSLKLASENNIKTIAFPAISIGAYGFPVKRAARIAIKEIYTFFEADKSVDKVFIVCYHSTTYEAYQSALKELTEL